MGRFSAGERRAQDTIDAIRLALIGAANERTALVVIRDLVGRAPVGDRQRTEPVSMLTAAIKRKRGRLRVAA